MSTTKKITWSTPKQVKERLRQARKELPIPIPGKRKYPCKKLKGPHLYASGWVTRYEGFRINNSTREPKMMVVHMRCQACGKKHMWWWSEKYGWS